jgi:DNA-binding LacI/PurR family transcriptional regulator
VTGFGNMLAPLLDALQLTTMAQPFERMGHVAGEMALARLNGPVEGIQEVELPMELIVRSSCGAR